MTDPNSTAFTPVQTDPARDADPGAGGSGATFDAAERLAGTGPERPAHDAGLRGAVNSDLQSGRRWARQRVERARANIADHPVDATLYALGAGVLIGLLLRR